MDTMWYVEMIGRLLFLFLLICGISAATEIEEVDGDANQKILDRLAHSYLRTTLYPSLLKAFRRKMSKEESIDKRGEDAGNEAFKTWARAPVRRSDWDAIQEYGRVIKRR